jgi:molybdopterin-guanine dinucleotide biosynthesis protein A
MKTAVVILAGGEGRRIGGGKPLRMLRGRSLIDRAVEFARRLSSDVALSVRDVSQLAEAKIDRILDAPAIEGPLAGLASALRYADEREAEALLTIPCDAPFLPPDLLERLSHRFDTMAAVPSSGGRLHASCALWRPEALDRLDSYLEAGRSSLHGFAAHVGCVEVAWPDEPFDPFFNINSEDDMAGAEALLT